MPGGNREIWILQYYLNTINEKLGRKGLKQLMLGLRSEALLTREDIDSFESTKPRALQPLWLGICLQLQLSPIAMATGWLSHQRGPGKREGGLFMITYRISHRMWSMNNFESIQFMVNEYDYTTQHNKVASTMSATY